MTQPEISIGVARRSDAAVIATLSRDLIESGLEWTWTRERVASSIGRADTIVAVAREANRIAGFGIMRYGEDQAHLDLLGVDRLYRRAGLGRRLVEWLEKPALLAGLSTVLLEVRASNHGARTFYRGLGYRATMEIAGYYQGRESAIRMSRELARQTGSPSDVERWLSELLRAATRPIR
jgi:ribosomal-protein-alanine N-acetyltransferase